MSSVPPGEKETSRPLRPGIVEGSTALFPASRPGPSGVYYVQVQAGADTISFDDPRPQTNIIAPATSEITDENAGQIHITTREGLLVLFPSWLQHQVPRNKSQRNRISVSFNVMFSRFGETMSQPKWQGNLKPE